MTAPPAGTQQPEPMYLISRSDIITLEESEAGLYDTFVINLITKIRARGLVWMTPEEEEKRIRADERAAENKRVLEFLHDYISKNQCDGSCPFDSMNEGRCYNYESCDLCVYDHAVESLRLTQPEPMERDPE